MNHSKKELEESIKGMQEVLDDPDTSSAVADAIKPSLAEAKRLLQQLETKPAPAREKKIAKTVKQIVSKAKDADKSTTTEKQKKNFLRDIVNKSKRLSKMYAGSSNEELRNDAVRRALQPGKRKSDAGNTYYENRANRSDIRKTGPYLAKGGNVKKSTSYKKSFKKNDTTYKLHAVTKDLLYYANDKDLDDVEIYNKSMEYVGGGAMAGNEFADLYEFDESIEWASPSFRYNQKAYNEQEAGFADSKRVKFESMYDGTVDAYPSLTDPDLYYYLSPAPMGNSFIVIAEKKGSPASEAMDDWFANKEDGLRAAKGLAEGKDAYEGGEGHFAKGGKIQKDKFIEACTAYLKEAYGLDPNDVDFDGYVDQAIDSRETPRELIDSLADKYDLTKREDFSYDMAVRTMKRYGFKYEKGGEIKPDQLRFYAYTTRNFNKPAYNAVHKAIMILAKEDKRSAYFDKASRCLRLVMETIDKLFVETNASQTHELLQRLGSFNYQTGNLVDTSFINGELAARGLAKGGSIPKSSLTKEQRLVVNVTGGYLAMYQQKFTQKQAGYFSTQKLMKEFREDPTDIGNKNMAILSLTNLADDFSTPADAKRIRDHIKKLEDLPTVHAKGGRIKSATNRDRKYKSDEGHEKKYKRKTSPHNPRYKKRGTAKSTADAAKKIAVRLKKK